MRVELDDGQIAILTLTRGVADPDALRARIADLEDVHLFDQRALMAELYGRHRTQTIQLVGIGLLAVLAMIAIRYRALGPTLAAFVPALLAGSTALAVLVLAGYELNLLHVVSVLLVQSMGVDYGVFLAENREHPERAAATVSSLLGCCISTVLAFGLLAMSSNPALRAIGLTVGVGVFASLVLAPTAMILFAGKRQS
jgi:predicted exporter